MRSRNSLPELATLLRAPPESDALVILGRLLDSLPIGFHITDCAPSFHFVYCNRSWERWVGAERLSLVGKPVDEVLKSAEQSGLTGILHQVCRSSRARHLRGLTIPELGKGSKGQPGLARTWDWETYPLSDARGHVTHLLNVVLDVGHRPPEKEAVSAAERRAENRRREEASGVLRIFGLAPDAAPSTPSEALTEREHTVANLVARGMTNTAIARELQLSHSTVSSHVASILGKLAFRSRAQIAAWVVQGRLLQPRDRPPSPQPVPVPDQSG